MRLAIYRARNLAVCAALTLWALVAVLAWFADPHYVAGLIIGACVPSLVALVSVPESWGDV